jgi:hypothetical protein
MGKQLIGVSLLIALAALPLWAEWSQAASSPSSTPLGKALETQEAQELQALSVTPPGQSTTQPSRPPEKDDPDYLQVIQATKSMISNPQAQQLADRHGLDILDITWEDTGRFYNSAVGPNISDMTIQVQQYDSALQGYGLHLMPVIRFPNYTDKTGDIPLEDIYVNVGNEKGNSLRQVPLKDVLKNLRQYLSTPGSWKGTQNSLLAPRDTHVLTSAQAAFLPIPKGGTATFNPVLFNYQSYAQNPAVLTILATREGTSVTIIDNVRDGFAAGPTWGQRLFFNKNGERASFTGQRISDFKGDDTNPAVSLPIEKGDESGLNMVMLIQVPLKQTPPPPRPQGLPAPAAAPAAEGVDLFQRSSDVEAAVIGHGEVEGPFTEIDNLKIERDPRFPIRVTVQFYKGTSNGQVSAADMQQVHDQIAKVYDDADYVGSLVVDGPSRRPTEHDGPKQQPSDWWDTFWRRHEANTGQSRVEAMEMLRRLRGDNWMPQTQEELERSLREIQPQP